MPTLAQSRTTYRVETGGAVTESVGGIAVIVLAILALVGVMPDYLAPIAGIVFGAAFIVEGAAIAARYSSIARETVSDTTEEIELGAGVSVEFAAGAAAIVLGILTLIGLAPETLMSVLVIAGGAGVLLSAGALQQLNHVRSNVDTIEPRLRQVMRGSVSS